MEKFITTVGVLVVAVAVMLFIAVITAIPTYFIWNYLMPELFGFKQITFVQAYLLNVLCSVLFKSSSSNSSSKDK